MDKYTEAIVKEDAYRDMWDTLNHILNMIYENNVKPKKELIKYINKNKKWSGEQYERNKNIRETIDEAKNYE